jgi:TIR domain
MDVVMDPVFQIVAPKYATAVSGIPLIRPVTVFLYPSGSAKSVEAASQLATAINDFLLDLSPQAKEVPAKCSHPLASIGSCTDCDSSDRTKLLILVGDEEKLEVPDEAWWLAAPQERRVLPVFKRDVHPEQWLSPQFRMLNAFFFQNDIVEATTVALSAADVTSDAHRLFISYRRLETQPLAEQLFSELARHGFEVFLDRFSVPAAAQFQRRLHHELAEKSMVLLLESDRFGDSKWTSEEIAYCKQYRLGLFSLRMPNGAVPDASPEEPDRKKSTRKLAGVDDDLRKTLNAGDFEKGDYPKEIPGEGADKPYMQWGPLTAVALPQVVEEIKRRHDQAQLRRLETIRNEMRAALDVARAGPHKMRADGMLSVDAGARKYAIWITTRPPELPDFQATYAGAQNPAGTTGVIVGHRQLLEPDVHRRLAWLSGVCRLVWVDEGNLLSAAYDIAGGTL